MYDEEILLGCQAGNVGTGERSRVEGAAPGDPSLVTSTANRSPSMPRPTTVRSPAKTTADGGILAFARLLRTDGSRRTAESGPSARTCLDVSTDGAIIL
jgi:hypothetical protein